jgi:hypothetical protein
MSELLSQLYTEVKHHAEAMRVHEEILRLVVEGDDDDDRTLDTMDAATAKRQLSLLKQTYLRLRAWDKQPKVYKDLVDELINMPAYKSHPEFKGVQSTDKWSLKEKPELMGTFTAPIDWEFADPLNLVETNGDAVKAPSVATNHGRGLRRITSNWGMNIHLFGQSDHGDMPPPKSSNSQTDAGFWKDKASVFGLNTVWS